MTGCGFGAVYPLSFPMSRRGPRARLVSDEHTVAGPVMTEPGTSSVKVCRRQGGGVKGHIVYIDTLKGLPSVVISCGLHPSLQWRNKYVMLDDQ